MGEITVPISFFNDCLNCLEWGCFQIMKVMKPWGTHIA